MSTETLVLKSVRRHVILNDASIKSQLHGFPEDVANAVLHMANSRPASHIYVHEMSIPRVWKLVMGGAGRGPPDTVVVIPIVHNPFRPRLCDACKMIPKDEEEGAPTACVRKTHDLMIKEPVVDRAAGLAHENVYVRSGFRAFPYIHSATSGLLFHDAHGRHVLVPDRMRFATKKELMEGLCEEDDGGHTRILCDYLEHNYGDEFCSVRWWPRAVVGTHPPCVKLHATFVRPDNTTHEEQFNLVTEDTLEFVDPVKDLARERRGNCDTCRVEIPWR